MAKKNSNQTSDKKGSGNAKNNNSSKDSQKDSSTKSTPNADPKNANNNKEDNQKGISFNCSAGKILIIRLFIKNKHFTPLLVRLSVDDWVSTKGQIYPTHNRIEPGYVYILPEGEAATTISLLVPENIEEDDRIQSNLRFPGSNEKPFPIEVTVSSKKETNKNPLEKSLNLSLPLENANGANSEGEEKSSAAIYHMVSGLANLSALPSQWLFAEGIVMICIEGEKYAREKEGLQLLKKLSQTRFYKNIILAFSSGRLPQWVSGSILSSSSLHAAMGGQFGQGRIVFIWLKWLLSMADSDIEDEDQKAREFNIKPVNLEEAVSRYGSESQIWAAYLVLGLTRISPKLQEIIINITKNISIDNESDKKDLNVDDILGESGPITK